MSTRTAVEALKRSLLKTSLHTLVWVGLGMVLQLGSAIILARVLGDAEYGRMALVVASCGMLAIPAELGMRFAAIAYLPRYAVSGRVVASRALVRYARRVAGLASVSVASLAVGVLALGSDGDDAELLILGMLALPFMALFGVEQGIMRGLGAVSRSRAFDPPLRVLVLLIIVGGCAMVGTPNATAGVTAFVVSWVPTWLAARWASPASGDRAWSSTEPAVENDQAERSRWWGMALPTMFDFGASAILVQMDIVLLGMLGFAGATVAHYTIASRLTALLLVPVTLINLVFGPRIAAAHESGDAQELAALTRRTAIALLVSTSFCIVPLALSASPLLGLFGGGFNQGTRLLHILLIARAISALAGAAGTYMTMLEFQLPKLGIQAAAVGINAMLNVVWIPQFGGEGAAIASVVATATASVGMVAYLRRRGSVDPSILSLVLPVAPPHFEHSR